MNLSSRTTFFRLLVGVSLFLKLHAFLTAQEIGIGGVSAINTGLAGVAVALPTDSGGALSWNPSTIAALEKSEWSIGIGRANAPWYGDECIIVPAAVVGWVLLECMDDDDVDDQWMKDYWRETPQHKPKKEETPSETEPAADSKSIWATDSVIRIPSISLVFKSSDERVAWGLGITEMGMRRLRLLTDPEQPGLLLGAGVYRTKSYEFTPTFAIRSGKRLYFGFSPVFSIDEFPTGSLPYVPGGTMLQRSRSPFGFGFQVGSYLQTQSGWNYGFSVRTPQLIMPATLRWDDPHSGKVEHRRFYCAQDWPLRLAFGLAYTGFSKTEIAFDLRYFDYSHADALYRVQTPEAPMGHRRSSSGFCSYALALRRRWWDHQFFQCGYQFNDGRSSVEDYLYNMTLPVQRGHSIHYGVTLSNDDETVDITLGFSHGFGDGNVKVATSAGFQEFGANPNNSIMMLAFRCRR